jgi:myo-inositol-1(or 4)-monophosphatase
MNPTFDWLNAAEKHIRLTLEKLRPKLLETQGNIEHHLKDDKTAVTEMDLLVEASIQKSLETLDGTIPFCGEETGVNYEQPTFWLVDPIDGTESFLRGMPFATNMLALIDKGQPVMSIIYNFTVGDYFLAIKGKGATCNGHALHVSDRQIERAYISTSSNPSKDARAVGLNDKLRLGLGAANVVKMAAGGYQNTLVATGATEAHVVFNSSAKEWDNVPGALLVAEAGGRIANIGSDGYDFRDTNMIVANTATFDIIQKFMTELAHGR